MPDGTGGFVRPVGSNRADGRDLLIDWRDARGAVHGDTVAAEAATLGYDGRQRGRVIKIIARTDAPIPATLSKRPLGGWCAAPLDPRMQQVISVPPTELALDGDFVTVLLDRDPALAHLKGSVAARLGRPSDLKIENRLVSAMFRLRGDFPNAVMEELAPFPTRIPEEWVGAREDLREMVTVTVDPATAKDFDDAISLEDLPEEEGGGWMLGVHIADVGHFVAENGPLDAEAQLRGTSVYFPDECIPMLPDRLSSELCSLKEGVDRLAMTAWMAISPKLEMTEARMAESVIRSRRRLTYDQVKEACIGMGPAPREDPAAKEPKAKPNTKPNARPNAKTRPKAGAPAGMAAARKRIGEDVCRMLDSALSLSRRLTEKRLGRGALNLDTEETEFIFDEAGSPIDARRYERHDAHRMIEEFMLLANEAVAKYFGRRRSPAIYRVHEEPDPFKLEAFKDLALSLGLMRQRDQPTAETLNALLDKVRGGPLEAMLNTMLLRSLKRAEYRAENVGHSGLALSDYLHFTSPIRRYPDLVVHRLLKRLLGRDAPPPPQKSRLAVLAKRASDCEQLATEAERECARWKACILMKPKLGERFGGTIIGFSQKAAFVRLDSPFVEVGVPLNSLGGHFMVDEHRSKATGMRGQVEIAIGAKVLVEITSVDESLHRISAWLLEAGAQDQHGKTITFAPDLLGPATLREVDFVAPAQSRRRAGAGRPKAGSGAGAGERVARQAGSAGSAGLGPGGRGPAPRAKRSARPPKGGARQGRR
jgi:ribonuclease R